MRIREAKIDDSEQLVDLLENIGWFKTLFSHSRNELVNITEKHIHLCLEDKSHSIYVIEEEEKMILGYISVHWLPYLFLEGPEGFISELFIKDNQRGKGIGTELLNKVKEEAKERGCSRLSLLNGKNRESYEKRFYQKQGFEERSHMLNLILKL